VSQEELAERFEEQNLSERFLRTLNEIAERTGISWPKACELFAARHGKRLADGAKGVEPRWIPSDIIGAVDLNAVSVNRQGSEQNTFSESGQGSAQPPSPLTHGKWASSRLFLT